MSENARGLIFRKRNVLGAALVAGIGLGIYLGQLGFNFGFGKRGAGGRNDGASQTSANLSDGMNDRRLASEDADTNNEEINGGELSATVPDVVRVVIDERQYLLREKAKETPISLPDLIRRIKKARGDEEHFKVRVFRKLTARPSAEEALKHELLAANIPETAVLWVPPSAIQWDENSPEK